MCDKNNNDNEHSQYKNIENDDDYEPELHELGSYRSIYKTTNKTKEFLKNIDESNKTHNQLKEIFKPNIELPNTHDQFKEILTTYNDLPKTHNQLKGIFKSKSDLPNTPIVSADLLKDKAELTNKEKENDELSPIFVFTSSPIIISKLDLECPEIGKDFNKEIITMVYRLQHTPKKGTTISTEDTKNNLKTKKHTPNVYNIRLSDSDDEQNMENDPKKNSMTKKRASSASNNSSSDSDDDFVPNIEKVPKKNSKMKKLISDAYNNSLSEFDTDLAPNTQKGSKNNYKTKKPTSNVYNNIFLDSDDDIAANIKKISNNNSKTKKPAPHAYSYRFSDSKSDLASNIEKESTNISKKKKPTSNAYDSRSSDSSHDLAPNIEENSKINSKTKNPTSTAYDSLPDSDYDIAPNIEINSEPNINEQNIDAVNKSLPLPMHRSSRNAPTKKSSTNIEHKTLEPEIKYPSNSNFGPPIPTEEYSTGNNDYLDSLSYPNTDDQSIEPVRSFICRTGRSPPEIEQEDNEFNTCACSSTEDIQSSTETKQSVFHSKYEMWMRRYVARLLKCSNEEKEFIAAIKNDVTLTPNEQNAFIRVFCEAEKHVPKEKQTSKEKLTLTEKFKQKLIKKTKQTEESNTRQILDRYETCPQPDEPSNEVYDEMRAYFEKYVRDYLFTWNRWLLLHLNHVHKDHAKWMGKVLSTKELTEENKEAILRFLNGDGEPLEKILQNQRKNRKQQN